MIRWSTLIRAATMMLLAAALPAAAALAAGKAPATPAMDGKALFHEKCAMCHGPVGMGTGLLARRVQPAMLEQRTDLTAEYVIQAARAGIGNMPRISRGEVSDRQMKAIADWLAKGNK